MSDVGHPIVHLDEPGACLFVIVNSTQELPARICAALDLTHWATRTFLPREVKPMSLAHGDLSVMSESDLCAMLPPPTEGMASPNWKEWWEFIKPIVAELIRRWLFS